MGYFWLSLQLNKCLYSAQFIGKINNSKVFLIAMGIFVFLRVYYSLESVAWQTLFRWVFWGAFFSPLTSSGEKCITTFFLVISNCVFVFFYNPMRKLNENWWKKCGSSKFHFLILNVGSVFISEFKKLKIKRNGACTSAKAPETWFNPAALCFEEV